MHYIWVHVHVLRVERTTGLHTQRRYKAATVLADKDTGIAAPTHCGWQVTGLNTSRIRYMYISPDTTESKLSREI